MKHQGKNFWSRLIALTLAALCALSLALPAVAQTTTEKYDRTGDGVLTIEDVTRLLNVLADPPEDLNGYDVNGDGLTTIGDVTALLNLISSGAPAAIDAELEKLTLPASVSETTVVSLATASDTYQGMTFTWTSNAAAASVAQGQLTLTPGSTAVSATVTVTASYMGATGSKEFRIALQAPVAVSDTLTNANTYGATGTTYKDWTLTGASGAVYAGQSAGASGTIQLRSKNSNSGIVTTSSGGKIASVKVTFNGSTSTDRVVDVYGKNSAYTDATDLYDSSTQGTKLGSLTYDGETASYTLTVTGDYAYVGLRSNNGALYLDEIVYTWDGASGAADPDATDLEKVNAELANVAFPASVNSGAEIEVPVAGSTYGEVGLDWEVSDDLGVLIDNVLLFEDVTTDTAVTVTVNARSGEETGSKQFSVTILAPSQSVSVSDTLTNANTYGATGTTYKDWTLTGTSGAVYAGQSAGASGTIQLRSKNSDSGIVTTSSGGTITSVKVTFNGSTSTGRIVDVYGKNSAYTAVTDLYASSTQGTKLGSLTYDGSTASYTLTVSGEYTFIALRSNNGALYLDEIVFTWNGTGGSGTEEPTEKTPEEIVNGLYELGDNQTLPGGPYVLTGVVTAIPTAYSTKYENVTVTIVVNGMTQMPVDCYRMGGTGVDEIEIGDTITVSGELQNYYSQSSGNTYEFKAGCQLVELVKQEVGPAPDTEVETGVEYPTLDDLTKELDMTKGLPSTGNVNVLVIPVGFTNSDAKYTNAYVKEQLNKAFNGTNEETGWRSFAGYYEEVSYGKLHFTATVTDIYNTGKAYDLSSGESGVDDYAYLSGALQYFDASYDYSQFDTNDDGYVDCVYLVYLAPYATGQNDSDLWWAYTWEFMEEEGQDEIRLDGKGIDWYMWFSIEFFYEKIYNDGEVEDDLGVTLNTETVIHETGHAMGLDDYYDYSGNSNVQPGLGGLVMMDWNQGDHDPFSKAILGWINPTILKAGEYSTTLQSYTRTGDALFVARQGNGSLLDEFYIITFYTPDGVNALKAQNSAALGYDFGVLSQQGVLIYHVNSTMKDDLSESGIIDIYAHTNCDSSDRLIKVVEKEACVEDGYAADSAYDLFQEGDSVKIVWNDGTNSHLTVNVNGVDDAAGASISITWG